MPFVVEYDSNVFFCIIRLINLQTTILSLVASLAFVITTTNPTFKFKLTAASCPSSLPTYCYDYFLIDHQYLVVFFFNYTFFGRRGDGAGEFIDGDEM